MTYNLKKEEARLFITGVLLLTDLLNDFLDVVNTKRVTDFEKLNKRQKIILLARAAKSFTESDQPACCSDIIWTVYEVLKINVQVEMSSHQTTIRKEIETAYLKSSENLGEYDTIIDLEKDSFQEWCNRLNVLESRTMKSAIILPIKTPRVTVKKYTSAIEYLQGLRSE